MSARKTVTRRWLSVLFPLVVLAGGVLFLGREASTSPSYSDVSETPGETSRGDFANRNAFATGAKYDESLTVATDRWQATLKIPPTSGGGVVQSK